MNKTIAAFPGSFDPFHNGHLHILEKALKIFDEIYIVIAQNPKKDKNNFQKNVINIKNKTKHLKNVFVLINKNELTANFIKKYNINFLIRSLRDEKDYWYEVNLAKINKEINPNIETILFLADEEYLNISSTNIKNKE
ncbi:pantetheine-phosphate adenylyltransferase [Mycoplasma leonicaptivi]|uniref:pantetheine-phosphate adenylyltransferase n=1 Tax=Mycoplasma leonicaptivi TaxID=36742 RepID=UPI0004832383|nr:pantetheine-phosphate adenylyltransferase [Mycoplasma leonicaptivi]